MLRRARKKVPAAVLAHRDEPVAYYTTQIYRRPGENPGPRTYPREILDSLAKGAD